MPVHTGTNEGTWSTVANCSDIPTRECPATHVDHDVVVSAAWLTGIPGLGDALAITPAVTPPASSIEHQISMALPVGGSTEVPGSWQIGQVWIAADDILGAFLPPSMTPFPAGTPFWYRYEWRDTSNMCVPPLYGRPPDGLPAAPAATDSTVGVTGDADDQQPLTVPGDGSTAALASMAWPAVCPPPDLYVPVGPAACGAPLPVTAADPLPVSVTDPVTVTNPSPVVMAQGGSPFAVVAGGDELILGTSSFELLHLHAVVPPGGWVGLTGGYRFVENLGAADIEYGPIILSAPQGRAFPSMEFRAGGGTSAPTTGSIVVWTT